ncbi:unnamed protein product [Rotaria sp. Silwood2]|nr:unnamed protein product [Rotaria sp. Silwood2]CAF2881672.1 unnamed protein product [Rotaria sp. Silwood2]CAF3898408.1 unnamed protein product [Rotaria sp. Silwood2]
MRRSGLTTYGTAYGPHYGYGEIENYGSTYQSVAGGYPFGYGRTDEPLTTTVGSPLGGLGILGQQELRRYGRIYPVGFNPMLQPGLSRSKVRVIFVPNHVLSAFQNLRQQYGGGFVNPFISSFNPFMNGYGALGIPQMMPQMAMFQGPMSPMGSNCCSMSFQLPSMGSQFSSSIPYLPPMIQPAMPPMPMPYSPQIFPMVPQQIACPPQFPIIPQQQIYPQSIPGNFGGAPFYGGFGQGLPLCGNLNSYREFPSIGDNILANFSGMSQLGLGQSALAAYGNFGQSSYGVYGHPGFGGYSPYGFPPYCQPGFSSYGQQPFGSVNQLGLSGFPQVQPQFGSIYPQQLSYNTFPQQPYSYYPGANINLSSGQSPFNGVFQPGIFPPASNFPSTSHAQLGSFPGSSGRVSIVCCIIPH